MGCTACTEPQCLHKGDLYLPVLKSLFHSSLLCTFPCHPSPPTILPSSLTSSCHLFLGLPLNLVVPKFIYNTLLVILFPSILCTCPNQHNVFNLIVSIRVGFLTLAYISLLLNPLNAELNPICYLLALLGAYHFLHITRIRVKSLTLRLLTSYIHGVPILDVSRSHTTTHHSR